MNFPRSLMVAAAIALFAGVIPHALAQAQGSKPLPDASSILTHRQEMAAKIKAELQSPGQQTKQRAQQSAIGYRVLPVTFTNYAGVPEQQAVAIWYPSKDAPSDAEYALARQSIKTSLAKNGAVSAPSPRPLLIFSHGGSGSALGAIMYAEALAREGFIVASIDYPDEYYNSRLSGLAPAPKRDPQKVQPWLTHLARVTLNSDAVAGRTELSYRPRALLQTINMLLAMNADASSPFYKTIDPDRIGLFGHSFGGWTTLIAAGADARYTWPNIRAVIAMGPPIVQACYSVTAANEIAQIQAPMLFMFGDHGAPKSIQGPLAGVSRPPLSRGNDQKSERGDDHALPLSRQPACLREVPNAYMLEIPNADHFSFTIGKCPERNIPDHLAAHPEQQMMVDYTVAFFKAYLLHDPAGAASPQPNPAHK